MLQPFLLWLQRRYSLHKKHQMGFFSPAYVAPPAVASYAVDDDEYEEEDLKLTAAISGQAPTQQMVDLLKQVL